MSERLGLYKKVMLELNHAVLQKRIDEHELHQLFWEKGQLYSEWH